MKTPTKKYIVKVKINNKYKNIKVYAFSKSNATHKATLWEGGGVLTNTKNKNLYIKSPAKIIKKRIIK